jgi:hypothetical protein
VSYEQTVQSSVAVGQSRPAVAGGSRRCVTLVALVATMAGLAAVAPASGQVSFSVGVNSGYGSHGRHVTGPYQHGYTHGYHDARSYRRPGTTSFFSYHDYGQKNYRSSRHSNVILPSHGYSTITPGYAYGRSSSFYSRSSSSSTVFLGGSTVIQNTVVQPYCPPAFETRTVYVERPIYRRPIVERTVVIEKPVERTVYIEQPVERTVYIEKPVERTVYIEQDTNTSAAGSYLEEAERAHKAGDWHTATRLYEKSILYRQDVAESRRGLALVYLETDQLTEALRQFERAYEDEPSLALRVLDDRILAGSRLGYAMEVAKRAAERQSSARAWLAVAVLRQASGDREGARFAISEASRFGLHHRVVDSFYEATGR